eukprot:1161593-Pelagomonas_calceolata.AAC.4
MAFGNCYILAYYSEETMEAEAMPFIKRLGLQRDAADSMPVVLITNNFHILHRILQPAPCVTFSGKACDMDVHVVWNGRCGTHGVDNVGTVPAALSTYIAAQAFKPQVIISAGTAGGFKSRVCLDIALERLDDTQLLTSEHIRAPRLVSEAHAVCNDFA